MNRAVSRATTCQISKGKGPQRPEGQSNPSWRFFIKSGKNFVGDTRISKILNVLGLL